ncbi:MAG TPA: PepSY-like domain-containing protein [Parafilimonas sp.]|nr:PepSY-like domain-containing protein [Parafilimonas sp.]
MKKLFSAVLLIISVGCFSQNNIPQAVQESFNKKFANTTVKKWDKEDGGYEANFSKDGKSMSATFDANGTWKETETDIKITELPTSISEYIKANYKNAGIKEAAVIETTKGKMYEAEVKDKDLLFDMNGKFLKEEED